MMLQFQTFVYLVRISKQAALSLLLYPDIKLDFFLIWLLSYDISDYLFAEQFWEGRKLGYNP